MVNPTTSTRSWEQSNTFKEIKLEGKTEYQDVSIYPNYLVMQKFQDDSTKYWNYSVADLFLKIV
jgi:hypothetical protein